MTQLTMGKQPLPSISRSEMSRSRESRNEMSRSWEWTRYLVPHRAYRNPEREDFSFGTDTVISLTRYKRQATKNVGRLEQEVTVFSSASVKARRDNSVVVLHMFFRSVPLFFVLIHVFFREIFLFLLCHASMLSPWKNRKFFEVALLESRER